MTFLRATTLLLFLPLVACNKGPEKVSTTPTSPAGSHMGMGAATDQGQMPDDATHGGSAKPSPHAVQDPNVELVVLVEGEVELAGEYAGVAEGWLFITTVDPATGGFGYTSKVAISSGSKNEAGNQIIPIKLTTGDFALGVAPGETFDLKVQYDHDGSVNMGGSTEGIGTVVVPVTKGQTGIKVTIDQAD